VHSADISKGKVTEQSTLQEVSQAFTDRPMDQLLQLVVEISTQQLSNCWRKQAV